MNKLRLYYLEIILIIGYLVADILHNYSYKFSDVFIRVGYTKQELVYYVSNYIGGPSVLAYLALFLSAKEINKKTMRLILLILSVRDTIGELCEAKGINIMFFDNYELNQTSLLKLLMLVFVLFMSLIFRTTWISSKYFSYRHLLLLSLSLFILLLYIYIK